MLDGKKLNGRTVYSAARHTLKIPGGRSGATPEQERSGCGARNIPLEETGRMSHQQPEEKESTAVVSRKCGPFRFIKHMSVVVK